MNSLTVLLFAVVIAVAAADVAYYVPKSFYTIDRFGHESAPVMLLGGPRVRRSASPESTASSHSYSTNGDVLPGFGPIAVPNFGPPLPDFNQFNLGAPVNFDGGPQGVAFRGESQGFGGIGISAKNDGPGGTYTSSSSSVDENGKVTYTAHSGKL